MPRFRSRHSIREHQKYPEKLLGICSVIQRRKGYRKYHVDNNTHCVRGGIASRARGREGIGSASIAVLGKVIIRRVRQ
jgi:hypothetical protein